MIWLLLSSNQGNIQIPGIFGILSGRQFHPHILGEQTGHCSEEIPDLHSAIEMWGSGCEHEPDRHSHRKNQILVYWGFRMILCFPTPIFRLPRLHTPFSSELLQWLPFHREWVVVLF